MFEKLQQKWKVSGWRLLFILVTFATGGSLTGLLGKQLMKLMGIVNPVIYIPLYIIIITLIWPFMVLLVSIPFGQFPFFRKYIGRIGNKISRRKTTSE